MTDRQLIDGMIETQKRLIAMNDIAWDTLLKIARNQSPHPQYDAQQACVNIAAMIPDDIPSATKP